MSIERLRALAAELVTEAYPLCLNRGTRAHIVRLSQQLDVAHREVEKAQRTNGQSVSMTDEDPAAKVDRLTAELVAAYEAARADTVAVLFKRLPATREAADDGETAYSTVERRHADTKNRTIVDMDGVADELLPLCYLRTESADSEDLGWTWVDILKILDNADVKKFRDFIIGLHHIGTAIPFDPRTSGQPETT